jgi:hypothetical protein
MESPEDIEKALFRLMPAAFSKEGQRSLDELVDSLAAGETVVKMPRKSVWPWVGGIGAAAAAVVVALNFSATRPAASELAVAPVPAAKQGGIVLIQQTERVETAVPEDWMSETDGVAHRAWRVRVVDEERLRDLETGYEVLVSRPREEVILMPVTAF